MSNHGMETIRFGLAKTEAHSVKLCEYNPQTDSYVDHDKPVIDAQGNIYISIRMTRFSGRPYIIGPTCVGNVSHTEFQKVDKVVSPSGFISIVARLKSKGTVFST